MHSLRYTSNSNSRLYWMTGNQTYISVLEFRSNLPLCLVFFSLTRGRARLNECGDRRKARRRRGRKSRRARQAILYNDEDRSRLTHPSFHPPDRKGQIDKGKARVVDMRVVMLLAGLCEREQTKLRFKLHTDILFPFLRESQRRVIHDLRLRTLMDTHPLIGPLSKADKWLRRFLSYPSKQHTNTVIRR